jgi:hypothetical protein
MAAGSGAQRIRALTWLMAAVRAVTAPARGGDQDPQRFSLAAQAWLDEMVAGEDLAGCADRVEGVAFAAAASWSGFRSAHPDDSLTGATASIAR